MLDISAPIGWVDISEIISKYQQLGQQEGVLTMLPSCRITNIQRNFRCRFNIPLAVILFVALTLTPQSMVRAQTTQIFNSGSNGTDGPLNITQSGVFDPRTFTPRLDQDGDNVFHFTTITIAAGVTITLSSQIFQGPVVWLATGSVQIDGVIDLSGQDGHMPGDPILSNRKLSIPGPGGYSGGIGQTSTSPAQAGSGPGGGRIGSPTSSSCGASYTIPGKCNELVIEDKIYGNNYLFPLIGGSGGGGSFTIDNSLGGGGGAGGGALVVASTNNIIVNGLIKAKGGSFFVNFPSHYAGGGSGGSIHLLAPTISGTGLLDAGGGIHFQGFTGTAGSPGRIRLDAFQHNFTGASTPSAVLGTPVAVLLTNNWPKLRIAKVLSVAAPSIPSGEHGPSDLTISAGSSVTVTIEALNVPVGQKVNLYVYSENAPDQIFESTPLVGTFAQSTATISATIPFGASRLFLRSDWTP